MTNTTLALCAILVGSSFITGCAADDTSSEQSIPRVSSGSSKSDSDSDSTPSKGTASMPTKTTASTGTTTSTTAPAADGDNAAVIPAKEADIPDPAAVVVPQQQIVAMSCNSDEDSITASYKTALLRAPDSGGLSYYLLQVQSGAATRLDVLRSMVSSTEFLNARAVLTDDQFLTSLYTGFLARQPDAGGKAFWANALAGGMSRASVALSFINDKEFANPNSNKQFACFF